MENQTSLYKNGETNAVEQRMSMCRQNYVRLMLFLLCMPGWKPGKRADGVSGAACSESACKPNLWKGRWGDGMASLAISA